METFPEIETQRLHLTALQSDDIPQIIKHANNKHVSEFTMNIPFPYAEKDAVYWINQANEGFKNGSHFIFGIRQKHDDRFIGGIGLTMERYFRAEIGYWIAEPYWNKGLMTEAVKAVIHFGFQKLNLNKIICSHFDKNPASVRVMINCGMTKEGDFKEHIYKNSAFHNLIIYGLTRKDYEKVISNT